METFQVFSRFFQLDLTINGSQTTIVTSSRKAQSTEKSKGRIDGNKKKEPRKRKKQNGIVSFFFP